MVSRFLTILLLVVAAVLHAGHQDARAQVDVDLELALAVDISGSIDREDAEMQRQGYIRAFRDPAVLSAISRGVSGRIAVLYFEWAGPEAKTVVVDWTLIDGPASAFAFTTLLQAAAHGRGTRTSLSGAIEFAIPELDNNGYVGRRRVVDISANGENNFGSLVNHARDLAVAAGITVNGLPIVSPKGASIQWPPMPQFLFYFQDCVIGGPSAFAVVARGYEAYGEAIRKKLIIEIAGLPPPAPAISLQRAVRLRRVADVETPPCDIGERRFEFLQRHAYPR